MEVIAGDSHDQAALPASLRIVGGSGNGFSISDANEPETDDIDSGDEEASQAAAKPKRQKASSDAPKSAGKAAADGRPRGQLPRARRRRQLRRRECNWRKNSRHLKVPCHQSFFSNLQKDRGRLGVGATARKECLDLWNFVSLT